MRSSGGVYFGGAACLGLCVLALGLAGCETPTHRTVHIHEFQREVPSADSGEEKRKSDAAMVSPGRMVSPGSMREDR